MKKLTVPVFPTLDVLELSSLDFVFENKACRESIDVINWSEFPYKPITVFDIIRSEKSLYLRYFVRGNSLKALYSEDNSPVHLDSCVEFFMKRDEYPFYINFEFNCIGTCHAERHINRKESTPLSKEELDSIQRYSTIPRRTFPEKQGIYEWELYIKIPFSVMGLDGKNLPEKIWGNFYKCADETVSPHYVSWSPIDLKEPDFHCPPFFGEIFFK